MNERDERWDIPDGSSEARAALPTIAVLPYFCIDHGTVTREFGACMTFAVATALGSVDGLHVISPSSTLHLAAGKPRPAALIARKLKVRYLLSGQIVQADQTLCFTHKLIDAVAGTTIGLSSIEVSIGQLQDVERGLLPQVIAAVLPDMREDDIQRALGKAPESLTAHEALVRGIIALHTMTRESHARAEALIVAAKRRARGYASAYAWHARLISIRIGQGWAVNRQEACAEALELAHTALRYDPGNALALATAGHLHSYLKKDTVTGLRLLNQALRRSPNEPLAWLLSGVTLAYVGRTKEGCRRALYALSLSPLDRAAFMFHSFIGACLYADGRYEASRRHSMRSLAENPNYSTTYRVLAAALVGLGQLEEARRVGARMLELEPDYPAIAEQTAPFADPITRDLFLTHLKAAGILKTFHRRHREAAE